MTCDCHIDRFDCFCASPVHGHGHVVLGMVHHRSQNSSITTYLANLCISRDVSWRDVLCKNVLLSGYIVV